MTKQYHIDSVHEMLGDPFRKQIEKQTVEAALNHCYNQMVFDLISGRVKMFDLCRKRFNSVTVSYDTTNAVYYSNWPKAIVPNINLEMIINTVQGSGIRIGLMTESDLQLSENLPVNNVDTTIYAIIKRERLEYYNMETYSQEEIDKGETPTPLLTTVRMDLAIQFKEFSATDEVYMPMGRDYEVHQLALDMLRKEPIMEIRNN